MSGIKNRIKLGIIGCGRVAHERHLPAIRHLGNIKIVAAADSNADRVNVLAERYGIQQRFTDYKELLSKADVDAVGVLTPTSCHAEISLAVLESGRHLLIEKPLALNTAECDAIISKQRQSDCKAVVGFNLRWHRLVRKARQVVQSGRLGKIKAIRSVYTHDRTGEDAPDWHRKQKLGGGVTFNESIHHFDLWRYLVDAEVEDVHTSSRPSVYYEDEIQVTQAVMTDGILASGLFSFMTSPNSDIEIYGENGRLHVSLYRFDGLRFYGKGVYPGNIMDRVKKSVSAIWELPRMMPVIQKGGDFAMSFCSLWGHFADCITYGSEPECTLVDGKRAVQIALSALGSEMK